MITYLILVLQIPLPGWVELQLQDPNLILNWGGSSLPGCPCTGLFQPSTAEAIKESAGHPGKCPPFGTVVLGAGSFCGVWLS